MDVETGVAGTGAAGIGAVETEGARTAAPAGGEGRGLPAAPVAPGDLAAYSFVHDVRVAADGARAGNKQKRATGQNGEQGGEGTGPVAKRGCRTSKRKGDA